MSTVFKFFHFLCFGICLLWGPITLAQSVNVNTATIVELQTIKGIGVKTAERIIEERERGGNYESIEDFSIRVKGLGQKRAAKMVESGLVIDNEQASIEPDSANDLSEITQIDTSSVLAKEITAIKKRFNYKSPSKGSETYLIKAN